MEDDVGIRKLVELIFVKKFQVTEQMAIQDSSFPPCLLTKEFPLKLRCVLIIRQTIIYDIWRNGWPQFYETYILNTQPSIRDYLKSILTACFVEHTCLNKVFDSFISACALVRVFGLHISHRTGMNYFDFSTDIVLEFYESVLKNSFLRCGGFQRLVGYIHQHEYLKWKMDMNEPAALNEPDALDDPAGHFNVYTAEKIEKEKRKERDARNLGFARNLSLNKLESLSESMAEQILSTTSVKLSQLACSHDPNQTGGAMNQNENGKTAERTMEMEADQRSEPLDELPRCMSLNSDSKANHAAKHKDVIPRCESIVQAVITHNRSKSSDLTNSDNQLLVEANEILDHLKVKIKSVIEILDEYEKE